MKQSVTWNFLQVTSESSVLWGNKVAIFIFSSFQREATGRINMYKRILSNILQFVSQGKYIICQSYADWDIICVAYKKNKTGQLRFKQRMNCKKLTWL